MDTKNNTGATPDAQAEDCLELPPKLDLRRAFLEAPPALDFVLPGLLAGTVGSLVSPGGVGKSFLSLEVGLDVATGSRLTGIDIPHRGRVVVFAGEDPSEILMNRLHALGEYLTDAQREDAYERLEIIPLQARCPDIASAKAIRGLEAAMTGARLAFLDTLTRFHSLDENASGDAKAIMANIEGIAARTRCATVFLHHVSKASALAGMAELQQAARGSSVFVDNARWHSFLAGMSEDEAKDMNIQAVDRHRYVRWNTGKQNYSARGADVWYERQAGGVLVPKDLTLMGSKTSRKGFK